MSPTLRVIGPGRAGRSLALALEQAGWTVAGVLGRGDDLRGGAHGVDLLVIATPDDAVAEVARQVEPQPTTVVAHMAGSLTLDVLEPHERRASIHPLVSLPDPEIGARRLADHAWFAIAGDAVVATIVDALGGRSFVVDDAHRAAYHAAASIAANHLVALLGQVERLAAAVDVPFEAYLDLATATLGNVAALGAKAALTGPAARGDTATIERHLAALPAEERPTYEALATEARRLACES